jgi:methionyl-tRNA formyltransferase
MLQDRLRPKWALSCYCPQIFKPELLGVFEAAINYHNSLLPAYRGLRATAWSMYHGEDKTGFSFHFMTEEIDAGRVLLQRSIPITKGVSYRELELNKALLAKACLNEVLTMIFAGNCGKPVQGQSTFFTRKAWYDLTTINDPNRITALELIRRLQCFEILKIRIRNRYYPVTRLVETSSVKSLSFSTEDGVTMTPVRFLYLPYFLYKSYQLIRKDL